MELQRRAHYLDEFKENTFRREQKFTSATPF